MNYEKQLSACSPFVRQILVLLLWSAVLLAAALPGWSAVSISGKPMVFPRAFAPSEGMVAPPEQPWREELCLNGQWRFQPVALPSDWKPDVGAPPALPPPSETGWAKTPIKIPSPWNVNAFNKGDGGDFRCFPSYPASWETAEMGWMERTFSVPAAWKGRRLRLHFEAVAGDAVVLVNGQEVGHNFDSFLPFECDVTDAVQYGGANTVRVGVRKPSLFNDTRTVGEPPLPRRGRSGGSLSPASGRTSRCWRMPAVRVTDVYVQPQVSEDALKADVTLQNDTPRSTNTARRRYEIQPWINLAGAATDPRPGTELAAGGTRPKPARAERDACARTVRDRDAG